MTDITRALTGSWTCFVPDDGDEGPRTKINIIGDALVVIHGPGARDLFMSLLRGQNDKPPSTTSKQEAAP